MARALFATINTSVLEGLKEETELDASKLEDAMNFAESIATDVVAKIYPKRHTPEERAELVASAIIGKFPDTNNVDALALAQRLITIVEHHPA
jgi:hypothetical protein